MDRNRRWKVLGLAGLAGVVATGVLVARDERSRRAYTPDEVRDRLQQRLDEAERASSSADDGS
ncbi:MAG: hypothetical protein IE926_19175 [Micrococcales bacterium]|uniref:hypothetical protein n=1 Tax=Phycicoccus sp. TaxID=1902410 RepID=UPI0019BA0BDF|nr:hypothetical protein [Phycicoccus sp.]MBD3785040.1 hypothetical protein [Micrococcales bacterium]HMM96834.1 hypothetical protein [Phycicoccus sp.]